MVNQKLKTLIIILIIFILILLGGCFGTEHSYEYLGAYSNIQFYPNSTNIDCTVDNFNSLRHKMEDLDYEITTESLNKFKFIYKAEYIGTVLINNTLIDVETVCVPEKILEERSSKKYKNDNLPFQKEYEQDLKKLKNYNQNFSKLIIEIYNVYIYNETYERYDKIS